MALLILLRHAKTEATASSGRDFDRALTERGWRDAALIGQALAERGLAPDLVLVSTARRAMQTCEAAAPAFPDAETRFDPGLYHASPIRLDMTARAEAGRRLMIVAHNPGLHDYALELAAGQEGMSQLGGFPTAAAAVFDIDASGAPRLKAMLAPSALGGGAS